MSARVGRTAAIAAAYIASVAVANYVTAHIGFVPVGFGLTATAGTVFAGLCLALRDALQDAGGRAVVVAAIAAGALLSAFTSTPTLAIASAVAFAVSELADAAVYTPIRRRAHIGDRRWTAAVIASGVVGAILDTVVFLHLAGFPVWASLPGQLLGKTWPTLAFLAAGWLWGRRTHAVRRHAQHAQGA